MVTVEAKGFNLVIHRPGPSLMPKIKEIQKDVRKLWRDQESAVGDGGARGGIRTGTKT